MTFQLNQLSEHATRTQARFHCYVEFNLNSQNAYGAGNRAARRAGLSLYRRSISRASGFPQAQTLRVNPFS